MTPQHIFCALCLLVLPTIVLAETGDMLSAIPQPAPRLEESTIIQGTGWSAPGNRNPSLACELAENRALRQLKKGITVAQQKRLITPEEFSHALPLAIYRTWDPGRGICTIKLQLVIPVQPKDSVPIVHGRQF